MIRFRLIVLLLAALSVWSCAPRNYLADSKVTAYRIDGEDDPDPLQRIDSIIGPYRQQLTAEMDEIIGTSAVTLEKAKPAGSLNNWFADALLHQGELLLGRPVDGAHQNYGGIRLNSLAAGPITRGKIFELMPFDNQVTFVEMDSSMVQAFCDMVAADGGEPVSSTIKFGILDDKAHMIEIHGQPLSNERTYTFVFPDYVANGNKMRQIIAGAPRDDRPMLIRDMLISEVQWLTEKGLKVEGKADDRIYFVND